MSFKIDLAGISSQVLNQVNAELPARAAIGIPEPTQRLSRSPSRAARRQNLQETRRR